MTVQKPQSIVQKNATAYNSAFYVGDLFHKRLTPKIHQFRYPLYMSYIDLDEVPELESRFWWFSTHRLALLQLKTSDYFRDMPKVTPNADTHAGIELKQAAKHMAKTLGADVSSISRVGMLAQLRSFGLYFSPVNFYFLYAGDQAKYALAEVSNTPWHKTHCYLVDLEKLEPSAKSFHVSPFMDLDMCYHWQITPPTDHTRIQIENWRDERVFTAVFAATRHEMHDRYMRVVFLRWPMISLSILRAIYWQALRLFMRGIGYVPYQDKPSQDKTKQP